MHVRYKEVEDHRHAIKGYPPSPPKKKKKTSHSSHISEQGH